MNKYLMLISLLLVGLTMARPPEIISGTEWNNYAQACCGYYAADSMLIYEYNNFLFGAGCGHDSDILDEAIYFYDVMWGDGEYGLRSYYYDYEYACGGGGEGTPDCAAAKSILRSQISADKGTFLGGKIMAYQKARQAVLDNRNYDCGTTRADVLSMMMNAMATYHECNNDAVRVCFSGPF